MVQSFADPYILDINAGDINALQKCCVGELIPDGRVIPFCAYNSVGYREAVESELTSGQMQ